MTSIGAWCDMMKQFLDELVETFPEEKCIQKYSTSFDILRKSNPRKCIETFMFGCNPLSEKIMTKNEDFFLSNTDDNQFIKELNLQKLWTVDLSDNTKNAIWQYLQTLFILGTTITTIPSDALNMIEDMANKCAGSLQSNGTLNEKQLMSGMTNLISSFGSMLEKK
jgi:hypothetical protein